MAECRCYEHRPKRRKHEYSKYARPLGYPNTSSICADGTGLKACLKPGLIWLNENDIDSFNNPTHAANYQGVFGLTEHNGCKMKMEEGGILYDETQRPQE